MSRFPFRCPKCMSRTESRVSEVPPHSSRWKQSLQADATSRIACLLPVPDCKLGCTESPGDLARQPHRWIFFFLLHFLQQEGHINMRSGGSLNPVPPSCAVYNMSSSRNICYQKICFPMLGGGVTPSTQRYYRRLLLLLKLLNVSVVRPSSGKNIVNYILKTILILGVCILLRV
jgi:hypothetical protein